MPEHMQDEQEGEKLYAVVIDTPYGRETRFFHCHPEDTSSLRSIPQQIAADEAGTVVSCTLSSEQW